MVDEEEEEERGNPLQEYVQSVPLLNHRFGSKDSEETFEEELNMSEELKVYPSLHEMLEGKDKS